MSPEAIDFVTKCLMKEPIERPSAAELLEHPWLAENVADVRIDSEAAEMIV